MNIRKLLLFISVILYFIFMLSGCSVGKKLRSNYDACMEDPACYGQMLKNKDIGTMLGQTAAVAVPVTAPYAPLIGSSIGQLVFLLTGVYLGRKKVQ